jgi:3-hydroxyisobutyrate dehydrogenase
MARIGFIGLGHMGAPMVRNLLKAGHELHVFDLSDEAVASLVGAGASVAASAIDAAIDKDFVITMLPEGAHVRQVYLGDDGVLSGIEKGAFICDCSTIDVNTAREVAKAALALGHDMVDAPVSGGVKGAELASLTFMVGGAKNAFDKIKPILDVMGENIFHTGNSGTGQAAKICNNMMLAINMIATCEGFLLAEQLGLDKQVLFDVASTSSGQSWSLTSYCPVPGPVEGSPANNNYEPGFTAAMMFKDLRLAAAAMDSDDIALPLGKHAHNLYEKFCESGFDMKDFSGIIEHLSKQN